MIDLTGQLPRSLTKHARWDRLGESGIPVMLAHPDWEGAPVPVMLWMHGRTATKELDPGRYLRWIRAGFAACAIDLPGHGERSEASLQEPARSFEVVTQMIGEIDEVISALAEYEQIDRSRLGIGGMSAGGMAALARLCTDHPFTCASVEATSGSWAHQCQREMFRGLAADEVKQFNPIEHLDGWREIPLQAFHSRLDEWVDIVGQEAFIAALEARYRDSGLIDLVVYDRTEAPMEHIGFGRNAVEVKNRQAAFLARHLLGT